MAEIYNVFSGEGILVGNFWPRVYQKHAKIYPKGEKKRHGKDCKFWNFYEMKFYEFLPDSLQLRFSLICVYIVLCEGNLSRLKLTKSVPQSTVSEDSLTSLAIVLYN